MIGEECKNESMINEHIPKYKVESGNKSKKCVNSRKKKLSKALGRKYARLNERQEETKTIQQRVVQLILKLIPISEHSQLETKKEGVSNLNYNHKGSESPQMHPRVERNPNQRI